MPRLVFLDALFVRFRDINVFQVDETDLRLLMLFEHAIDVGMVCYPINTLQEGLVVFAVSTIDSSAQLC